LAGKSSTEDVDGFDGFPVDFGYVTKVGDAGESCVEDSGWCFVEFAMPDDLSADGVYDAKF
jgi:hypothetical protein